MKKYQILLIFVVFLFFTLNYFKKSFVMYLPFDLPGKQMAITVPPFGIFIESEYKKEKESSPCSILTHEKVHWKQYERMGLFYFYYNYLTIYIKNGRIKNWMEEEARKPCKSRRL